MNELDFVMRQRVCIERTRVEYIAYKNEDDLLNGYANFNNNSDIPRGLIGIVFQMPDNSEFWTQNQNEFDHSNSTIFSEEMNRFLDNFRYKIRTTSHSVGDKENAGPYQSNLYLGDKSTIKSFLETQIFINEAYLSLLMKRANILLINKKEQIFFAKKNKDHQERVDSAYELMKSYDKFLDFPSNQSVHDAIVDAKNKKSYKHLDDDQANSLIDLFLINQINDEEKEAHSEFLKNLIHDLATEHPLFIQVRFISTKFDWLFFQIIS